MIGSLGEPDVTFIVVSCSRCSLPFSLFAKFIFGQVAGDQFRVPSTTDTRERERPRLSLGSGSFHLVALAEQFFSSSECFLIKRLS